MLCEWGGERIARKNNLIRDGLYYNCSSGALGPTSEGRPVDILLADWTGGKDTALDIMVVDPLKQPSLTSSHWPCSQKDLKRQSDEVYRFMLPCIYMILNVFANCSAWSKLKLRLRTKGEH